MTTENESPTQAVPATTLESGTRQQHPRIDELTARDATITKLVTQGKTAVRRPVTKEDLKKARSNSLAGGLWS